MKFFSFTLRSLSFVLTLLPVLAFSQARVQVIHNSADAAASVVDVWLNDQLLIDDFAFRTASPFIDAPSGVDFDVVIQPSNSTDTTNALARFTYNLTDGETYVLVANGIVVPTGYNPATPFDIYVYPMGRESATSPTNTDLLVFHGSTDAPVVDVVEVGVGAGTIVDNLAYSDFDGYLELSTLDFSLQIRDESGTTTVAQFDAPLSTLGLDGAAAVVVASGFLNPSNNNNGPAFGLYVALPSGGNLVALPSVPISTARIQVIHNSADAAAAEVDVWLNDQLLIDNFAFRTASPFIDAPTGVDFDVVIQPASSTDTTNALARFTYNLTGGSKYVLVANGIVVPAGYNPATPFDIYVYDMGREAATSPSNADVLVFHGSTDAPVVDVVETGVGAGTIVDNLAYGDFAGYLELPADDYVLDVRDETGTVTVARFAAPLATLGLEGAAMAVVASGFLDPSVNNNGAAFGLFVALPAGGALVELPVYNPTARVQVIHNSADAAAAEVDVWLNDQLLIDNFAFRTASPFIDAPAEVDFDVVIQPANSTDTTNALARFTYNLTNGETYVLVANGIVVPTGYNPATPFDIYVYPMGRESATSPTNTDLLVFHGSTDAPVVDVVEVGVGAGTIVDNLAYSDFDGYLELPTLDFSLQIRDESGTTTVAQFDAPLSTLGLDGAAAVVVASGFLNPSNNNNGPAFGLYVALPSGGDLVALPSAPISTARIQVIHNSSDAAAAEVDVWLNDQLLIDNFAFRTASPFIDAPAGVDFDVVIQPASSTDTTNALARFTYNLNGGSKYVLVANGIVVPAGYNPATPFDIYVYDMGREAATSPVNSDVLVFHGSTDAPVVDVVETGAGAGTIVDNLAYGDFAGYLELPTDDYVLDIRDETGTVTVARYSAPLATLGLEGAAMAVVASGFLDPSVNNNGATFGLFVALPAGGALVELPVYVPTARIQVIHNSADAAAAEVDVWLNDQLLIDNFAFRTASPFIDAPAEVDFDVVIQPANSTDTTNALARFTYNLVDGETYVLVANGIVVPTGYNPATPFDIYVYGMGREAATSPSNADVLVFHGSTDAPVVDVVETGVGAGTIVDNLAYGDFAGYLELPADDYVLDIRDETGTVTVARYAAPLATLGLEGAAMAVVASGFLDPSVNNDGAAFGLFVALPSGGALVELPVYVPTARVQVIHNSADAAAAEVDVWLNDQLLIDNFAFRTASPFIDAPAEVDFDVVIQPANSTDTTNALARFTYNLVDGETYVLVANGIVVPTGYNPATPFDIYVYGMGREAATSSSNTDVLVFHGSTDAPVVDIVEVGAGAGTLVDDIAYGEYAGYLELPTADYSLQVRDASGTSVVAEYLAPLETLGLNGAAAVALASGFLNPAVNNDGPAFGIYVALPTGGELVALPATDISTARLQVIHNSADAAAAEVDVWLNDQLLIDNFAFRTATPFIDAPAGVDFDVVIQPANSTDTTNALARFTYNLTGGEKYILVANGIVVPGGYNPATPFDLYAFGSAREMATDPMNTDMMAFHGSTDAPVVDIVETWVGAGTIIDNLAYGSFAGYLELQTLDYIIDVRDETGTAVVATYLAPLASLSLGGQAISVIASGFLNPAANNDGPAFGLYVALASGGDLIALPEYVAPTARVQVIHNSADAAAAEVDVWLNDQLLLDNFAFMTASPFIDAPAGVDFDIVIQPASSTDTTNALARFTYNLEENGTYILVANGIVSSSGYTPVQPFNIYVYDNARETATSGSNTDVLVFHGSTDAPVVDVVEVYAGAGTIVDNLAYGSFAGYLELPTANYQLEVRDETGTTTVAVFNAPLASLNLDGQAISLLASGFLDPSNNSNGAAFGLYAVLASGGDFVALGNTTGINENSLAQNLNAFPNPASYMVNLSFELKNSTQVSYEIYNTSGRMMMNTNLGTLNSGIHLNRIDTSVLPSGFYLVKINAGNTISTIKIQVSN